MKPIIFSGEMVQAILGGRKTQTRRGFTSRATAVLLDAGIKYDDLPEAIRNTAPYKIGDILWVRETFAKIVSGIKRPSSYYIYRADGKTFDNVKWGSPLYMPRAAARIFLRVTDVRVERLHDITDADAHAEGMDSPSYPIIQFKDLWRELNDKRGWYSWNSNPRVWVVEFERVDKLCYNISENESIESSV